MRRLLVFFATTLLPLPAMSTVSGPILNTPPELSADFADPANTYFLPADLTSFEVATGRGSLGWRRHRLGAGMTFNHMNAHYEPVAANEWPKNVYAADPALPFAVEFVDASTLRIRLWTSAGPLAPSAASPMLARPPVDDGSWHGEKTEGGYRYTSPRGSVFIGLKPWRIELRDPAGRVLTRTVANRDLPGFGFVRRADDYSRSFSAAFSLEPGEKIFGCGESFTALDKRGQKFPLSTTDALGTEGPKMYKPVPFFLSNRGYGMFLHTSSPVTVDFGATNASKTVLTVGEDALDLFVFLGEPKEVIGAYTGLTGRSAMPPLWSFGLWMSRITYKSEAETREVAAKLRSLRLPADVIHLDTGWFQNDWECDYRFSAERFEDPAKMVADLKTDGFHISLWQLPYFIPKNPLFPEIIAKGLAIRDAKGNPPTEDAILDFSNPAAVAWYQEKLAGLLRLGVGAIKTDFAEAAPYAGLYASGTTGFFEHNLYPLRYQEAAADITRKVSGDSIIWARAGWAGAQRNPVHWGGDSAKTFSAMAGTLRGGLSLGVSGFSFWSHDIGGFFGNGDNVELYRRWLPFGMLTSHARVHGEPPKEPWLIGEGFVAEFRASVEMRYRLMPYIYAQARDSAERGLPMLRALFIEFPRDPGAWLVDDAYLFGSALYVAPLFEAGITSRDVYLPAGAWIDYQTGKAYAGGWHHLEAGPIPAVILVRDGSVIPHAALAQSTKNIDWSTLELRVFATAATAGAEGLVCLPGDQAAAPLEVRLAEEGFRLARDPLAGRVSWSVHDAGNVRP